MEYLAVVQLRALITQEAEVGQSKAQEGHQQAARKCERSQ